VRKVSSKDNTLGLSGAHFSGGTTSGSLSPIPNSDANGYVCVDGLTAGSTYYVKETQAPANYNLDDSAQKTVTVAAGSCATSPNDVTFTFTDSPQSNLSCTFTSVVSGATTATMTCKDSKNNVVFTGPLTSGTAAAILQGAGPDTYTCTIVIDP
jgi:uncharacterized surface anchored protein